MGAEARIVAQGHTFEDEVVVASLIADMDFVPSVVAYVVAAVVVVSAAVFARDLEFPDKL